MIRSPRAYLRDCQIAAVITTIATSIVRMIIAVCTKASLQVLTAVDGRTIGTRAMRSAKSRASGSRRHSAGSKILFSLVVSVNAQCRAKVLQKLQ